MRETVIISPSGNFYGSEQVLLDYLRFTGQTYLVWVPGNSVFYKLLMKEGLRHRIQAYRPERLKLFYLKLLFKLGMSFYNTIYLNEAGHSKYMILLAKIFTKKKFVIHLRIVEDTREERWPKKIPSNVQIVSISKYIEDLFFYKSLQLYDPYNFTFDNERGTYSLYKRDVGKFYIGIIGRISTNKGLYILLSLLEFLKAKGQCSFIFKLFGTPDDESLLNGNYEKLKSFENVVLHGFVLEKGGIYNSIDCVMHLAHNEPLGRIFPESINHLVPLIGFKSGGIGEIGTLTGLSELLIEVDSKNVNEELYKNMILVKSNIVDYKNKCLSAKLTIMEIFSISKYTTTVDELLG